VLYSELRAGEPFVAGFRRSAGFALVAAVIAALGLSGCGRKGGLDLPPGDMPTPTANAGQAANAAPGTAPNANPGASLMPSSGFLSGQSSQPPGPPPNAYDAQGRPTTSKPQFKSFPLDPLLQ